MNNTPDRKVRGAYMGPTWGRQDPGGPHVGPMDLAIKDSIYNQQLFPCIKITVVTHTWVTELGHRWFSQWFDAC